MNDLEAPGPDGQHLLRLAAGTHVTDNFGATVMKITVAQAETVPDLPVGASLLGHAYDFEPSGIAFDKPASLTLSYDVHDLPAGVASVTLAYYQPESGWTRLEAEGGTVAGLGNLTAPITHFTLFAILVTPTEANMQAANLAVTPLKDSGWRIIFPLTLTGREVVIGAQFTNSGGTRGLYDAVLKLDGEVKDHQLVLLGPGETKPVTFRITGIAKGTHSVEIGGLTAEFTTTSALNWWIILLLVILIIVLLWLFKKYVLQW